MARRASASRLRRRIWYSRPGPCGSMATVIVTAGAESRFSRLSTNWRMVSLHSSLFDEAEVPGDRRCRPGPLHGRYGRWASRSLAEPDVVPAPVLWHPDRPGGAADPRRSERVFCPRSLWTNADDRLPLASLGRVEGRHSIVEGRDVADVGSQPSVTHPLDDLTQLEAIGFDNEVDGQAVHGPGLGRS